VTSSRTCPCGLPAPVWVARLDSWRCPLCADGIDLKVSARAQRAREFRERTAIPVQRQRTPDLFNRGNSGRRSA
jgi:hypothetical protein